jgi:cytochrome c peroxidase
MSRFRPTAIAASLAVLCAAGGALADTAATASRIADDPWRKPEQVPTPPDNALTPERVALGKTLFFDPRLSSSNWISCASCHNPGFGWSDGLPTARGDGMKSLPRNSPTIVNTAFNPIQMWDGRKPTLEAQALGPMESGSEMNQDPAEVAAELGAIPAYVEMFEKAYPGEGITPKTLAKAIASFERTVVSGDAPFDRWRRGELHAMSEDARQGFALFTGKANCAACHSGWNFTDNSFHNLGLASGDPGRYAVKPLKTMQGAFKTPTLREIAFTAPYMHNGSYATLREVIDHYDRGGDQRDNLSPEMKPLGLSEAEKAQLEAFMLALSSEMPPVELPILPQ